MMTKTLPPHTAIRPLNVNDIDNFLRVEGTAFTNPDERCSKEKALYRLKVCPELSCGVFIRTFKSSPEADCEQPQEDQKLGNEKQTSTNSTMLNEQPHEENDEDYEDFEENSILAHPGHSTLESEQLIAHIIGTKMTTEFITNDAMQIPDLDEFGRIKNADKDPRGHREEGRSIGIHSVAVDPSFQGKSIGTIMLKDYIQRITTQHIADRIAIIAHSELVPFYNRLGFVDAGQSSVTEPAGDWRDMWVPLSDTDEDEEE